MGQYEKGALLFVQQQHVLLGVCLSQVADMGMLLCLLAYLQSTPGTSADCGCLLLYRGGNKYTVVAVCIAGHGEFVFKAQVSLLLILGGGGKLTKISLEEQMPSGPL